MKSKLVYGVGINDTDYPLRLHKRVDGKTVCTWRCPYYRKWDSMLYRCYSKKFQEKYPTYKDCIVCEEWLTFSNFKSWMEQQEWEGRQLDKDFLVEGDKVYSPSTCVFVPDKVNTFIITQGRSRGDYPIGVRLKKGYKKNPYQAGCRNGDGEKVYLGLFPTPEEAHQAWLVKKLELCNEYLQEFKGEFLIVKGLTRIKDKLEYYIDTNTELTSF